MRTTARTPWLSIDRKTLLLVAAGTLVAAIIATTTLTFAGVGGDESHTVQADVLTRKPVHHPTDRGVGVPWTQGASQTSNATEALDANGLPIAPIVVANNPAVDRAEQMRQYMLESFARRDANRTDASDRTTWKAFPGHEGFTYP